MSKSLKKLLYSIQLTVFSTVSKVNQQSNNQPDCKINPVPNA